MNKLIGYFLAGIGIIFTAFGTIPNLRKSINLIPESIPDLFIMTIGAVIVIIGIIFLVRNPSSKQPAEVPIYHGKNVVGFRRMGK
jgi:lysylphosphatidylglycerol synthetase-like protein (DUF2156 family)